MAANLHRNPYIDFLRAAAICPVLLGHWNSSGLTTSNPSLVGRAFDYLAGCGSYGVLLFFVISGFVITRSAMSREGNLFHLSYRTFYPRRFGRIFPLLAVVCCAGILLIMFGNPANPLYSFVLRDPTAVFDPLFWASILTFTFNQLRMLKMHLFPGWGLQWDILWSLAVEEQFYLAFPVLLLVSQRRPRLLIALIAIIAIGLTYHVVHRWDLPLFSSIAGFELIATGILCAVFAPQMQPRLVLLVAVIGGLLLCGGFLVPRRTFLSIFRYEFIAVGAGALLCCSASASLRIPRFLVPIAAIGELSYGMYLLHPLVLYLADSLLGLFGHIGGYAAFVVGTALIAGLSYKWFEKPSERVIRAWLIPTAMPRANKTVGTY
jgi:peptidoglycan/LPS O-acetylase OafA/YrhL